MKKTTRNMLIGLGGLAVVTAGALTLASHYMYSLSVKRNRKEFLNGNPDLANKPKTRPAPSQAGSTTATTDASVGPSDAPFPDDRLSGTHAEGDAPVGTGSVRPLLQPPSDEPDPATWFESQPYEAWEMQSEDGLKLVGYYLPAKEETTKTVILAHGYACKGKDNAGFVRVFHDVLGFNVLSPDARGHGDSGGDYIGFGWPERKDWLGWIARIIERVGPEAQIILHGVSMGGATVMMVSGEPLPPQVKVIVEDCGYTSAADQLSYQLKRMYGLPKFPLMQTTNLLTNLKAGYDLYEASALEQVKKSTVPMMFIHGSDDTFVPTDMVYRVFDACPTDKELFVVEGAGHGNAYTTDKIGYLNRMAAFICRFVS